MLEALRSPIHVGTVTLTVRDLPRVRAFYVQALGLIATGDDQHTTLAGADGSVLLHLVSSPGAAPSGRRATGLFHTAFLLPERRDLARWTRHALTTGVSIDGASDHLVSEAVYLSDPEGNGIEVYVDRPRDAWPRNGDGVAMATEPLDGASLMAEIAGETNHSWSFPAGGRIGHVHLKVNDLAKAEAFYTGELGMDVMARYPGAVFLSWGGYHHHVAVNAWSSNGAPQRTDGQAGLALVAFDGALTAGAARSVSDPAGNRLTFQASASIS
jgi:catechol 2,3-dioxygenase